MSKTPLGVMPRWLWEEKRIVDLKDAIIRYLETGKEIPPEWTIEYNDLTKKQVSRHL